MIISTLTLRETLNVCSNSHSGTNFLVIAVALIVALLRTDIGHRALLKAGVVFALSQVAVRYATAWDIAHHSRSMWTAVIRETASTIDSCCVIYFLVVFVDLMITFSRSEKINRLNSDAADDGEQARLNLSSLSATIMNGSAALLRQRESKGRINDHVNEHDDRDLWPHSDSSSHGIYDRRHKVPA